MWANVFAAVTLTTVYPLSVRPLKSIWEKITDLGSYKSLEVNVGFNDSMHKILYIAFIIIADVRQPLHLYISGRENKTTTLIKIDILVIMKMALHNGGLYSIFVCSSWCVLDNKIKNSAWEKKNSA